ncbi:MAG: DMT family transporter [Rhodospirillales bacterium]|nr:DMT family transporter [Rhodospirillales bacterium]
MTVLGIAVFSVSNALGKYFVTRYPLGEILLLRSAAAFLCLGPFLRGRDVVASLARGQLALQVIRMVLVATELVCFYLSVSTLPLAAVSTFYLAVPIYVLVLSAVFLRERVAARRWVAALVGLVGVLVALRPGVAAVAGVGRAEAICIFGSLCYSVILTLTRRLRGTAGTVLVAWQLTGVLALGAGWSTLHFVWPGPIDLAALAAIGLITMTGYAGVNRGLQLAPASLVAPFQYTSIVWATLTGFLVFGEVPKATTIMGAAIIIGAGLFLLFAERATYPRLAPTAKLEAAAPAGDRETARRL